MSSAFSAAFIILAIPAWIWLIVSGTVVGSYARSQGIEPRHSLVLWGRIWSERQNPARRSLIGLLVSTALLHKCSHPETMP